MNEVSLAFRTPEGLAVIVGGSHPGVERILEEAAKIDPRRYSVTGGFHLVMTPPEEVRRTADALHDVLKVRGVAPAHCTSELGFATFIERFKDRFDATGVALARPKPAAALRRHAARAALQRRRIARAQRPACVRLGEKGGTVDGHEHPVQGRPPTPRRTA